MIISDRISIRPATLLDFDLCRQIHHRAYKNVIIAQFGAFEVVKQDIFFKNSWNAEKYRIIIYDNMDCGYLSTEIYQDGLFVAELVVDPAYSGNQIGTKVLCHEIDIAKAGKIPVNLQVLKENSLAIKLYRRLGFTKIGETATHYMMLLSV